MTPEPKPRVRSSRCGDLDVPEDFDLDAPTERERRMLALVDAAIATLLYRMNVVVKASPAGGEFVCSNPIFETRRIKLFRPDACEHSVTTVGGGPRYVLSVGWIRR